jgi:DNA-directed RNA polymerase-3 subunit RPC5
LTPVHSTLQLRPQFSHVDAQNAQERAQNKVLRDADEAEKPSQARAVHLTVNQEVTQMSSTMKALRTAEEDEWKKLHWVDQEDDDAWNQYEMLCLRDTDNVSRLKTGTGKSEYMDWLSGSMMSSRDGGGE